MKIVYCIESLYKSGGMERVLTTKANYLSEQYGHEVHIVTMGGEHQPYFPLSEKIICHNLSVISKKDYRKKLVQLLYSLRPHITISMYGPEFTFLYKIKDGSKKIVEFHFTKYYLTYLVRGIHTLRFRRLHLLKAWLLQKREALYASRYDKVVLLTQQDLQIWGNKPNMCYIYNPVSFYSEEVSHMTNKRIIAMGRYIAQKGFDLLIDAFAKIASKYPDWELCIFGEGQDAVFFQNKIKSYRLEKQIHLCPSTHDVKQELLASSIFVFPSRYEGFGLVLTEAMECGLPCIAFDCECGPREIISDRESGFLVKNGDISILAEKMDCLMQNPELRNIMGKKGKQRVEMFYAQNIMPKWQQLFTQIIK